MNKQKNTQDEKTDFEKLGAALYDDVLALRDKLNDMQQEIVDKLASIEEQDLDKNNSQKEHLSHFDAELEEALKTLEPLISAGEIKDNEDAPEEPPEDEKDENFY